MTAARLVVVELGHVHARSIAAPVEHLLYAQRGDMHEAALAVSRITDEAIAIGRFQRLGSTLDRARTTSLIVRRATGGPAIAIGEGQLHVALDLAGPGALGGVGDPARILNRHLRPLLRALESQGIPAMYGGRDFIASRGIAIAWAGLRHEVATGRTGIDIVVATRRSFAVAADVDLSSGDIARRFGDREPQSISSLLDHALDEQALIDAIVESYSIVAGSKTSSLDVALDEPGAPMIDDGSPFEALIEVPIGLVGVAREGTFVRLGGDWMVSHDALLRLEIELEALPLSAPDEAIARALVTHLGPRSGALLFGVRGLEPLERLVGIARTKIREARG